MNKIILRHPENSSFGDGDTDNAVRKTVDGNFTADGGSSRKQFTRHVRADKSDTAGVFVFRTDKIASFFNFYFVNIRDNRVFAFNADTFQNFRAAFNLCVRTSGVGTDFFDQIAVFTDKIQFFER